MTSQKNLIVRFYQLPLSAGQEARLQFACQLAEKAFQERLKTVIVCPDEEAAALLDEKLWTLKRESFLPHCLLSEEMANVSPIILSTPSERLPHIEVQIDLSYELKPDIPRGCGRILEIITQEDAVLRSTRARFALYKERGWQPQLHKL